MDEKIKQTIEEMELVMHNALGCRYFNTKEMKLNNDRFFNREATALYNAGYRKESDTAKEILTELLDFVNGWFECVENNDFGVEFNRISKDLAQKYGVDLGE